MFESIRRLFGSVAKSRAQARDRRESAARRSRNQARLGVERLEERSLMAADLNDQMSEAAHVWTMSRTEPAFVQGRISGGSDVQMYSIYANAGEYYEFNLDQVYPNTQNLNAYMRIFDANGRDVNWNDDGRGPREPSSRDPYILHKFATSGNYWIGISDSWNTWYNARTGTGDYTGTRGTSGDFVLAIQRRGNDLDDQMFEAKDSWGSGTGDVTGGDVDMHKVWLYAGYRYKIYTHAIYGSPLPGETDPRNFALRVFTADGKEFQRTGMVYQIKNSGYYYVGISTRQNVAYDPRDGLWDNTSGVGGSYNWTTKEVHGPVFYTQNLFTNGVDGFDMGWSWHSMPGQVTGSDVSMYSFQVKSPGLVSIDAFVSRANRNYAPVQLRVFNSNGKQIAASGTPSRIKMDSMAPGWYYLGVSTLNNNAYNPWTGEGLVWGSSRIDYDLHVTRPGF